MTHRWIFRLPDRQARRHHLHHGPAHNPNPTAVDTITLLLCQKVGATLTGVGPGAGKRHYRLPGAGLWAGAAGAGLGPFSSGVGAVETAGELSGAGAGEGLGSTVRCFVLTWCLEESRCPAFSSVFPVFFNPLPTVCSVACAPCSIVLPVFSTGF